MKRSLINAAILGILGLGAVFTVSAQGTNLQTAQFDLCAGEYDIPANTVGLNNPAPIRMWGYVLGHSEGTAAANDLHCVPDRNGDTLSSPGPSILLPNGIEDTATVYDLQITLYNALPRATSLVIPGLIKPMTPVMFTAPDGSTRLHSFDTEVAPGGSTTYSWASVKQGAYIYQSGTHQQVQVQMGLAGAIMSDAFTGTAATAAYPGLEYDVLYPVIYSEIDPVIHSGVALNETHDIAGNLLTVPDTVSEYNTTDMKSTIDYAPKYFGITLDSVNSCPEDTYCVQGSRLSTFNGDSVSVSMANAAKPIVRLFNASSRIHTPTLIGANFDIVAEDGFVYPNLRRQYAMALPPLKTKDAILDTTGLGAAGGTIRLIDSAMNLSNPAPDSTGVVSAAQAVGDVIANGEGDMYAEIHIESHISYNPPLFVTGTSPIARRDEVRISEGGSAVVAVLSNDDVNGATLALVSQPDHGTAALNPDNTISYKHNGSESTHDSFLYSLTGSDGYTVKTGVVIEIDKLNDLPVAVGDSVSMKLGQSMEVRVLDNDTDAEGAANLRVVAVDTTGFSIGSVAFVDKAVTITGDQVGTGTVGYTIEDNDGGTASASISVTVAATDAGSGFTNGDNTDTSGSGDSITTGASPIAKDDSFSVAEGGVYDIAGDPSNGIAPNLILSVLSNDVANGGTVAMDEYPEHGAIEMNEDGTFRYTHNGDEDKEDHFSYTVFNQWGSDKAEVKIFVTAKMNPPRINDDRARVNMNQAKVIDILDNDKDRDSEVRNARIEIVTLPAHGTVTISADNKVVYTPTTGYTGKDSFTYRLYDDITNEASKRNAAKVKIRVK